MASVDENLGLTVESLDTFAKDITTLLSHSESGMESLRSLMVAFGNEGITLSVFEKSIQLLFDSHKQTKQEGEIRGCNDSPARAKIDENPKKSGAQVRFRVKIDENQKKSGSQVRFRVKIDENPKEDVSEGKKRRILHSEPTERTLKKQRKSRRLDRVTPSYKLIPEEQRHPVPNNPDNPELNCLNNKYSVVQFNVTSGPKKQSKSEGAIESCEEDMFETDMLMEALKSAVVNAEKVIGEKMSVEDLGVKFYRCIEMLYRGDMSEIVRENHVKALPVILKRLKQKLDELTVVRESWKPRWKKVFKENTRKQREATRKKLKKFASDFNV